MAELGKLSKLREQQVLQILADESPLDFVEINARRVKSGSLDVILSDLDYYELINLANFTGVPMAAIASITDKGRKLVEDLTN